MPALHLGVVDVPYSSESYNKPRSKKQKLGSAKRLKATADAPPPGSKSTGDVAEILEAEYHVMEVFFELHAQEIADVAAQSLTDFLEDRLAGARANAPAYFAAESQIRAMFVKTIDSKEMDGIQPGVPTAASLRGVNHRFLHPYARRGARPSFRDTGLYEASFMAWIEE